MMQLSAVFKCLPWLLAPALAWSNPFELQLDNGMKVLVKEDRRAPVIMHQVWYRIGSVDEATGHTGLSHVLEHMMFKGTHAVPNGEFSKRVAELGGQHNAGTTRDYTFYYQKLPAKALPEAIRLEADRMQGLNLSADEFAKEIKVVMEERRMRTENNPGGVFYERFMATMLMASPYRVPVIGWMDDLQRMTLPEVRDWYGKWYAPNNATLVVVGDVDHEEVFRLAREQFGPLKPSVLPERKLQLEPEQKGIKRLTVKVPAELPQVWLGWIVPKLNDPENDREAYALDVLSSVLDGHDAARLGRTLVREKQMASGASASYDGIGRGPGIFMMTATPSKGKTPAELEAALKAELRKIVDNGVSDSELKRVKAQLLASQVYQRDSLYMQAMNLGALESVGLGWRAEQALLDKVQTVTSAEVQAVAKKYLIDDNLTVGELVPLPLTEKNKPVAGGVHAR